MNTPQAVWKPAARSFLVLNYFPLLKAEQVALCNLQGVQKLVAFLNGAARTMFDNKDTYSPNNKKYYIYAYGLNVELS